MSSPIRDRVLMEALSDIAVSGYSDTTLTNAAERAGVSKEELQDNFPQGPSSLVEAFSDWADEQMIASLAANLPERMRDRITQAVRARIEVLTPHREAARRAAAFFAQPQHAALAAKLSMRSVDAMWRAAGDRSTDFSYYTRRGLLAGVYGATVAYWLSDSSEGQKDTWIFLDNRIGNVMQIEKWRGQAREAVAKLPDPFAMFQSWRGGRKP